MTFVGNLTEKIEVKTVYSYSDEEKTSNLNIADAYTENSTSDDKMVDTPNSEQIGK